MGCRGRSVNIHSPSYRRILFANCDFTIIDIVRSKIEVEEAPEPEEGENEGGDGETVEAKNPIVGPVTIWIGVFPGYG